MPSSAAGIDTTGLARLLSEGGKGQASAAVATTQCLQVCQCKPSHRPRQVSIPQAWHGCGEATRRHSPEQQAACNRIAKQNGWPPSEAHDVCLVPCSAPTLFRMLQLHPVPSQLLLPVPSQILQIPSPLGQPCAFACCDALLLLLRSGPPPRNV